MPLGARKKETHEGVMCIWNNKKASTLPHPAYSVPHTEIDAFGL